ncbi:HU family DNA-binding protein [Gracilimonas sp.]|uniref:HU family DNA-binding protein n=1 Tax=Gracilimonas sp. TaxID=1974203 RepID=UPI002871012F|nr:HU family DNA-binding protein [Gracilimonas sp.]
MSEKVTYGEIVDALARKSGQSKQKSEAFTKALIAEIKYELQENGKASITNFGSFKVKEVDERQGQNPQTGEPITIPAHKRVSFSPYKALRERVNAKYAHLETRLVKEGNSTSEKKSQPKEDRKKPVAANSKGMSTTTMVLGILVPAVVLILVALLLLFDPFGSGNTETSSVPMPPATEMPAQTESAETEQETEPEGTSQQEQPETTSSSSPETTTEEQTAEIDNQPVRVESSDVEIDYRVNQNEWYWVIAENIYGNAQFWPLLFQQNQSVDDDPDQVNASLGLIVPELEGNSDNLSEADLQKLATAARMVSEAYQNANKPYKAEAYARLAAKWEREIQ